MKRWPALLLALMLTACSAPAGNASDAPDASQAQAPQAPAAEEAPSQEELEAQAQAQAEALAAANAWEFDAPEHHGMDSAVLEAMHAALPGSGVHSVVTAMDGVIIDEYYEDGYDADTLFPIHSASKSFTSALIGIAIDEGYIDSIDDPISKYLPQVLEQEDTRKQQITLRHLLTQTSGLEWYEWGSGYSNWAEFRSADNWVDYILGRNLIYEPGTVFNYSTGNTHLLSAILEAATGVGQEEYCRTHLFDPMGITEYHWNTDPQGIVDGGNGLEISARDAAKFGQLFLNGGVWNGQQLVPADWVAESTSAKNSGAGDATGSYGYQWWMRSFTPGYYGTYTLLYPSASYDMYFAFGHGGQFIHVIPDLNMVCVFTSSCASSYDPRPYLTDYVLAAYTGQTGQAEETGA